MDAQKQKVVGIVRAEEVSKIQLEISRLINLVEWYERGIRVREERGHSKVIPVLQKTLDDLFDDYQSLRDSPNICRSDIIDSLYNSITRMYRVDG